MNTLLHFVETLNQYIIWGLPMMVLMIGTGLFFTIITKGVIFRHFGTVLCYTLCTLFQKREIDGQKQGSITPFQAVCTALAATVGTGNIIGVALAIATGGPGALFWLWISALLGMVLKYCEVTLSVAYRTTNEKGQIVGGPMYYISYGLNKKWLALLFAFFGSAASFGIGASVQANSLTVSVNHFLQLPTWCLGLIVGTLAALILIGGIKRIALVTERLVPFMAIFYISGALLVLIINASRIPTAILAIFQDAFTGSAATGGFLGSTAMYTCRIGMSRGVFTHEAGMGSAPIAHASANTDHPARQGLWGAFEVFFDSIVMCTITGLVILTSGVWCTTPLPTEGTMSFLAFGQAFMGGEYIVTIGLTLFAFATIISWYYYGEKCVEFLFQRKQTAIQLYQLTYIIMIFIGCVTDLSTVWTFADLFNGLMAIPNLIALIALSPTIKRLSADFFQNPHYIRPKGTNFL